MRKFIVFILLLFLKYKVVLSLQPNNAKYIKIPFTDSYSIPTIHLYIKNFQIETILDNNQHFHYISTKNFNLRDINCNMNEEKIIVNNQQYKAYRYLGVISLYDEKDYIELYNVNSYVIDENNILSSVTISYILQQLKDRLYIDRKIFYLDIKNRQCFFGEISNDSPEYKQRFNDNFTHAMSYSIDTKGVFKDKLYTFYIDNSLFCVNKNITFNINDKYSYVPYTVIKNILKDKEIAVLDCELFLIDKRGSYTIKCHKQDLNQLPPFFFEFNNYTFSIPFILLFEEYDENYYVSSIRTKIKVQYLEDKEQQQRIVKKEEENEDEWIFGYSFLKYFNYTIFDYDQRSVTFYSDSFIRMYPPKINKKIYNNIFYLINLILGLSCVLLIIIRIKIESIPLEAS